MSNRIPPPDNPATGHTAPGPTPDRAPHRAPNRGAHRGALRRGLVLGAVLGLGLGLGAYGLMGRVIGLPGWAVAQIAARANTMLAGQARLTLAGVDLVIDDRLVPRVRLTGVALFTPEGAPLALLPELRASLQPQALLQCRILPRSLRISGAQISLARAADGRLDLAFLPAPNQGDATPPAAAPPAAPPTDAPPEPARNAAETLSALLEQIEARLAHPALAGLLWVEADGLQITLDDARLGRRWRVSEGRLSLRQNPETLSVAISAKLPPALAPLTAPPAPAGVALLLAGPGRLAVDLTSSQRDRSTRLAARISNIPAADLAAQSPALAWLSVLDAPISGAISTESDAEGRVAPLRASLDIGRGALQPVAGIRPIPFDGARLALRFDPASGQIDFDDLSVESASLRVEGGAKAWLADFDQGFPTGLLGQIRLDGLRVDPLGAFENPVRFRQGAMDLRLRFQPFRLEVGQFVLVDAQDQRLSLSGQASAGPEGWQAAFQADIDAIAHDRLLALWPKGLVPKTRAWLEQNVATGELFDVHAAARLVPGQEPRATLAYRFRGAAVRVVKTLPPVEDGLGYATIEGLRHVLVVERGHVIAPDGGRVDMAGSVMTVPDITEKPTRAEVLLRSRSSIPSALAILDAPPLLLLQKAGRGTDLAQGRAEAVTRLDLPLIKDMPVDRIAYATRAQLFDVESDQIVPGRRLQAAQLTLRADHSGLAIAGAGQLEGQPFDADFRQAAGPGARGLYQVRGTAPLTPDLTQAFGLGLPAGMIGAAAQAAFTVQGRGPDQPPSLDLHSDLQGLTLALPEIGWSKPAAAAGDFRLGAILSKPVQVTALALDAPGLRAAAGLRLTPEGQLDQLDLTRLQIGNWFDGTARLTGRGPGRVPGLSVTGGRLDLRRMPRSGAQAGGDNPPFDLALDRLVVSDGLWLQGMRGQFSTQGGLSGRFTGRVNGQAPISGALAPARQGPGAGQSAIRLSAEDAGAVLQAARIFANARGGRLDMVLTPQGPRGHYAGQFRIGELRVVDAPIMAAILNGISVVGLLEQLTGEGILFASAQGRFQLDPDRLVIEQASAVGASMGISLSGVYGLMSKRLELRGVVSPVYLLNAVGRLVSRQGEGLFGVNYAISGTADQPRISVNPLSLLTPGIIREIFRTPPPDIAQ